MGWSHDSDSELDGQQNIDDFWEYEVEMEVRKMGENFLGQPMSLSKVTMVRDETTDNDITAARLMQL